MFQGRARELAELERLYTQGGFQMVVLYGRRRVGKTTLVREFAKDKPALFYTAKVQSDALNLAGFKAGECRLPLCSMSEDMKAKLKAEMEKVGLLNIV